jgi:hypothetical protein
VVFRAVLCAVRVNTCPGRGTRIIKVVEKGKAHSAMEVGLFVVFVASEFLSPAIRRTFFHVVGSQHEVANDVALF